MKKKIQQKRTDSETAGRMPLMNPQDLMLARDIGFDTVTDSRYFAESNNIDFYYIERMNYNLQK